MGREVRRVPATWEHPKNGAGSPIPLKDGFNAGVATWDRQAALWKRGLRDPFGSEGTEPVPHGQNYGFKAWDGKRPGPESYMPDWPAAERTHFQMYETTTEGTPISPVMESPETLARWLADTGASSFGPRTATYEAWLAVCRAWWAPGLVADVAADGGVVRSGVEFLGERH